MILTTSIIIDIMTILIPISQLLYYLDVPTRNKK